MNSPEGEKCIFCACELHNKGYCDFIYVLECQILKKKTEQRHYETQNLVQIAFLGVHEKKVEKNYILMS